MGNDVCCSQELKQIKKKPIVPIALAHSNTKLNNPHNSDNSENQILIDQKNIDIILNRCTTVQNNDKKYSLKDFNRIGNLGQGGFAIVDLVELKQQQPQSQKTKYAMKKIQKKKLFERRVVENLKLEKRVLSEIKNKFTVQLKYSFQDKYNCYFVMQYAEGGDLYSFLNNRKQPLKVQQYKNIRGEQAPRFILACVVLALQGLHRQNIMYRDLKPENVLIFSNGYPKLADFGLAKRTEGEQLAKTMAGTKIYFAPQIVQKKGHKKSVDFWTLGVFLYELIVKQPPFEHRQIVKGKFQQLCYNMQLNRDWKQAKISEQAKDLINSFLRVIPDKRLGNGGFDEIKSHVFFKDFNWQKLEKMELQSPLKSIVQKYPHKIKKITQEQDKKEEIEYENIDGITYNQTILKSQH